VYLHKHRSGRGANEREFPHVVFFPADFSGGAAVGDRISLVKSGYWRQLEVVRESK